MNLKNSIYRALFKDARKGLKMSPNEIFDEIKQGNAVLVDVREEDELLESGIAQYAKWLPTSEIAAQSGRFKDFVASLSKDKPVVTYCAAGVRSGRFAGILNEMGFQAVNIGGFDDWVDADLPVVEWKVGS